MYRKIGKRIFDIILGISASVLLSPLLLIIAFIIKVFDPGPVFFKQSRVGRNGESFLFYKFRSMPVNTGDVASDKIGEIKLTQIGKFIRRTNIDELPQILNILKGDMSIVGPRPSIASQIELIQLRSKNLSLQCVPGLTGLAQINSFDGMSFGEKATLDGEYAKNINFTTDMKIILKTFFYLLKSPPIY